MESMIALSEALCNVDPLAALSQLQQACAALVYASRTQATPHAHVLLDGLLRLTGNDICCERL
jgi:hypothetical protein